MVRSAPVSIIAVNVTADATRGTIIGRLQDILLRTLPGQSAFISLRRVSTNRKHKGETVQGQDIGLFRQLTEPGRSLNICMINLRKRYRVDLNRVTVDDNIVCL